MPRHASPMRKFATILAILMVACFGLAPAAHAETRPPVSDENVWFTDPYYSQFWNTSIIAAGHLLSEGEILAHKDFYRNYGFTESWFAGATIQKMTVQAGVMWSACDDNGSDRVCDDTGESVTSHPLSDTHAAGSSISVLKNGDGWIALKCGNFVTPTNWPATSDAAKTAFSVKDWPDRIDADTDTNVTVSMTFVANGDQATNKATDYLDVSGPGDCTIRGGGPFAVTLTNGVPLTVEKTITIRCTEPSNHTLPSRTHWQDNRESLTPMFTTTATS